MKNFKRILATLLAAVMVLSLAACGGKETTEAAKTTEAQTTAAQTTAEQTTEKAAKWPLAEKTTFTLMIIYDGDAEAVVPKVELLDELEEMTNVHIEFQVIPKETAANVINGLFTSANEGDAICQVAIALAETEQMSLYEDGKLIALEDYLTDPEICPNFVERVLSESPQTLAYVSSSNGHIMTFPKYNNNSGNYIESNMWINQEWLDKLGLKVPTTQKELEEVLIAFRDNDCNGNGNKTDEIPLLFSDTDNLSSTQALLYMWGLGTKNTKNDHYVHVVDGEVEYCATTQNFKDAMITLNKWYEEGLLYSEAFTANTDTFNAAMNNDSVTPKFGVICRNTLPTAFADQYVRVTPISADGYTAEVWMHPGYLGAKGMAAITGKCEQPEILASWFDLFYSFEYTVKGFNGMENVAWHYDSTGKVVLDTLSGDTDKEKMDTILSNLVTNLPAAYTMEDYAERLAVEGTVKIKYDNYEAVKDYVPDEFWPRCGILADYADDVALLYTDISTYCNQMRAEFITGKTDINANWDAYVAQMKKIGLEDYIEGLQASYDAYLKNMK